MKPMYTCLWFTNEAEEAAKFYTSIFKDGKMGRIARYTKEGFEHHGQPEGSIMTVEFEINGQKFLGLNGGPVFKFTEAISLVVNCDTQEEIDYYWSKLTEGGEEVQCGWLKDKYGLSWQIAPAMIAEMMTDSDQARTARVMKEIFKMKKLDLKTLMNAYKGQ